MLGVEMISFFVLLELSILCLPTPSTDSVIPVQEKNGYRSDSSNLINQKVGFIIYPYTASFLVPARCSYCITNPVLM